MGSASRRHEACALGCVGGIVRIRFSLDHAGKSGRRKGEEGPVVMLLDVVGGMDMNTVDVFGLRLDSSWMPWQTSVGVSKGK